MLVFWLFLLAMNLMIPLTMLGFGKLFLKNPPKTIHAVFGYRTGRSMKNQDTWDFAHRYCGKLWWKVGWGMVPFSILPFVFVFGQDIDTVGTVGGIVCLVQLIVLVGSIVPVEWTLQKTFDREGKRKQ